MFEFLSSPFGLVAVGLGVLAVAVLALCLWITALDRRMRGMADGLEAERRKVAEMQMAMDRRTNAARSYGRRVAPGAPPVGSPVTGATAAPQQQAAAYPGHAGQPGYGAAGIPTQPSSAARPVQAASAAAYPPGPTTAPRPAPAPGAGWTPSSIPMPSGSEVDAWVQKGAGGKSFDMPEKRVSRRARREAERAFAARAAAELEARQARRAQEAAFAQRGAVPTPAYGVAAGQPYGAAMPQGYGAVPGQPYGASQAQPYGVPAGRHVR